MTYGFYSYSGGIRRIIDGNSEAYATFASGVSVGVGNGGGYIHTVPKAQFAGVWPVTFYTEFTPAVAQCFKLTSISPGTRNASVIFFSTSQVVRWLAAAPMSLCPGDGSEYGMLIYNSAGRISYDSRRRAVEIRESLYFDLSAWPNAMFGGNPLNVKSTPVAISSDTNFIQLGVRGLQNDSDGGNYGAWWYRESATVARMGIYNGNNWGAGSGEWELAWSNWDGYAQGRTLTLKATV